METFGRIGRDPARIGPFLAFLGAAWVERAERSFGQLVCAAFPVAADPDDPTRRFPRGLQLVEEDMFLKLLDRPSTASAEDIEDLYTRRGPLGDFLKRLDPPESEV